MKNEIMTFSPVDSELLLSEMDMMEVYGGTGDGGGTKTYCGHAKCGCPGSFYTKCWCPCSPVKITLSCGDVKITLSCGGQGSGSGGQGSGSGGQGSGSGSGSGKGKGKGK